MVEGLVSAIIPVHNRPELLQEAVSSVLGQTYRPIEIIVVDDGSVDDTARVADALESRYPSEIRVLHQCNAGPGLAREAGRQAAKGEFIQYLDSDDILLPRKFELQVSGLHQHADCGIAYGKTHFCVAGEKSERKPWKRTGERIDRMFPSFLRSRWWGTSTPLYRRSLTDAVGPWLALRSEEDWEYDCRFAAMGVRLFFVDEFVSEEREHSGDRLSRGGSSSAEKLLDRAKAHALILEHARRAGIRTEDVEMQHYSRELFLLSRQCGAAGLAPESRELFQQALEASGAARAKGLDFRMYGIAAGILGWSLVGRLACTVDRLRK
jgi:glycosyltransferase involved in cell wall biosynthesis